MPPEIEEMREKEVTMASRPAYTMLFTHSPFQEDSIPSPLSEFCPYGLELPTRGVYVE